jgi:hypothetical protein
MGSVHARGDTFLTFGLKALTEMNTSRLATGLGLCILLLPYTFHFLVDLSVSFDLQFKLPDFRYCIPAAHILFFLHHPLEFLSHGHLCLRSKARTVLFVFSTHPVPAFCWVGIGPAFRRIKTPETALTARLRLRMHGAIPTLPLMLAWHLG